MRQATGRDRRPGRHGHTRGGPHDQGASAHVYHPGGVAGPAGHLSDPRRGSGAAHRGPARAGTHAGARGPGSGSRAEGGAPVTAGAVYRGAPPGVTRTARPGGRIVGARPGEGRWSAGVGASGSRRIGSKALPPPACVHPLTMREEGMCSVALLRARRVCVASLWRRSAGPTREQGRGHMVLVVMQAPWSNDRGHQWHPSPCRQLRKEKTLCIPYVACHG